MVAVLNEIVLKKLSTMTLVFLYTIINISRRRYFRTHRCRQWCGPPPWWQRAVLPVGAVGSLQQVMALPGTALPLFATVHGAVRGAAHRPAASVWRGPAGAAGRLRRPACGPPPLESTWQATRTLLQWHAAASKAVQRPRTVSPSTQTGSVRPMHERAPRPTRGVRKL